MALSGMFTLLGARGIDSISGSFKRKKLEKRISNGEKLGIEDMLWLSFYYKDIKKDYNKAEYYAYESVSLEPDNTNIKNHYFETCYLNKNYSKAKEIMEYFIANSIGDLAINYHNLGYMFYLLGNSEESNKYWEKAVELKSELRKSRYDE